VCVYKGVPYTQGQQWYDGCDKVCVCESGMTGYVRCRQRCSTYTKSDECTMVPDPKDPICCQVRFSLIFISQFLCTLIC
jgi:hypothetical protein